MREILYRGKGNTRFNSGDWYYGVPIKDAEGYWQICTDCIKRTVLPETIGEYTGLTDKNDKKIFEGDVIRVKSPDIDCKAQVYYQHSSLCVYLCLPFGLAYNTWHKIGCDIEVIGNIHDNPELKE